LTGANKLWIRFFLLSVYATMYVRDHARPAFHAALGLDPTAYDYQVFRICSEISKQAFPLTLDIDHPRFKQGFARMAQITAAMSRAGARGGVVGALQKAGLALQAGATFIGLYLVPTIPNDTPESVRLVPAW
jgi:magnesium-protoporphyrin IX monomethyl ester (oxidative) cyclase